MSRYDDIINHPHYQSATRKHMSMSDRAAQFSPFAALVGYDAAVEETARLTEEKIILDEDKIREINSVIAGLEKGNLVHITYFIPDALKSGGLYMHVTGWVKKIDSYEKILYLMDETDIPISDIIEIEKGNA